MRRRISIGIACVGCIAAIFAIGYWLISGDSIDQAKQSETDTSSELDEPLIVQPNHDEEAPICRIESSNHVEIFLYECGYETDVPIIEKIKIVFPDDKEHVVAMEDMQIPTFNLKMEANTDSVLIQNQSEHKYYYVTYDKGEKGVIDIPQDAISSCVSNNRKYIAYQAPGDVSRLIIRTIADETEQTLHCADPLGLKIGINYGKLKWNTDDTKIMFSGSICYREGENAKNVYGWIDVNSDTITYYEKENKEVEFWGNYLIVHSERMDYGVDSQGSVLFYDIQTGESKEYQPEEKNEDQFIYVVDAKSYATMWDKYDGEGVIFKYYMENKKIGTYLLTYEEDRQPSIVSFYYSAKNSKMYAQIYDFEQSKYKLMEIKKIEE